MIQGQPGLFPDFGKACRDHVIGKRLRRRRIFANEFDAVSLADNVIVWRVVGPDISQFFHQFIRDGDKPIGIRLRFLCLDQELFSVKENSLYLPKT